MARHGENIRKRKDGRWEGRYVYRQEEGAKSVMRSVYAGSYREVKKKLEEAKSTAFSFEKKGEYKTPRCSPDFRTVAGEWLAYIARTKKYSTYVKYKQVYEKYLMDLLKGHTPESISDDVMENRVLGHAMELLGTEGLTESLEKSIYCVVGRILSFAAQKYSVHVNIPHRPVKRTTKKPVRIFNASEQKKLMHFLEQDTDLYKLGVILCLYTGLRLGELCALKWSDIDMENKIIYVASTVQRLPSPKSGRNGPKTLLMETSPKSICSKREVPINDTLYGLLVKFKHGGKYVIGGCRAVDPRTYQKKFAAYLKKNSIEYRPFHTLRHTFASNCAAHGADAKALSEILGHSDVQITLNRYVHPSLNLKRSYLNLLSCDLKGQEMGQAS